MDNLSGADLIYALAVSNRPTSFFAARSSGLYCSGDGGLSWAYAYPKLLGDQPLPTLAVALSPAFEQDHTLLAGTPGAILFSEDGGIQWQVSRLGAADILVSAIAFSPSFAQDGTAFAITSEDGVFCSYDRGRSWLAWNFGLFDANCLCLAVSHGYTKYRVLFAGTSSGLFISRNAGKSWEGLRLPTGRCAVTALALSPQFEQDGTLWTGTETGSLLQSQDGGSTWTEAGDGLPGEAIYAILVSQNFPSCPEVVVAAGQTLFLSAGTGRPFSPTVELETEMTALCPSPNWQRGDKVYLGLVDQLVEVVP